MLTADRYVPLITADDDLLTLIIRTPLLIEAQYHAGLAAAEADRFQLNQLI
ncbi:hypothetical protein UUU_23070 [Klebsiella pneumoniae subsp. pneumoniae DSM 30104 = JCM 1662 = NBRC 14940]|nr:hypothetical protein UUU_23070 [Klebsiella pneumoniae subsp. pneumoniae DSM 30104 = JCM 1662 = NBRC 14940]